jgi:hypothetical protein
MATPSNTATSVGAAATNKHQAGVSTSSSTNSTPSWSSPATGTSTFNKLGKPLTKAQLKAKAKADRKNAHLVHILTDHPEEQATPMLSKRQLAKRKR